MNDSDVSNEYLFAQYGSCTSHIRPLHEYRTTVTLIPAISYKISIGTISERRTWVRSRHCTRLGHCLTIAEAEKRIACEGLCPSSTLYQNK